MGAGPNDPEKPLGRSPIPQHVVDAAAPKRRRSLIPVVAVASMLLVGFSVYSYFALAAGAIETPPGSYTILDRMWKLTDETCGLGSDGNALMTGSVVNTQDEALAVGFSAQFYGATNQPLAEGYGETELLEIGERGRFAIKGPAGFKPSACELISSHHYPCNTPTVRSAHEPPACKHRRGP